MDQKTILLVEDNPDDEELTLMALKKNNILNRVAVVRDGIEALDYLFGRGKYEAHEPPVLPDVVLLDLKLPKLGGLEVLERIRSDARTAFLPVVILTSSSQDEDVLASYRLKANSYVQKPVEFGRFAEAVGQVGLYWLVLNEPPPWAQG